jgi:hypothetical protein
MTFSSFVNGATNTPRLQNSLRDETWFVSRGAEHPE